MFLDLFYLMRARGLHVSMNEWLSLTEALQQGLCRNSLLEFYYISRAILVKTEADFDKFDEVFLDYFDRIQHIEDIPQELLDWLHDPKNMKKYDKEEVDARTTFDLEKLRKMLEERLKEQHERHDGGQYWVGTGGTSTMGQAHAPGSFTTAQVPRTSVISSTGVPEASRAAISTVARSPMP